MRDGTPRYSYRFVAIPPFPGDALETMDYGSNIAVTAHYDVVWVIIVRNVVVWVLLAGAAFLIAAQNQQRT